MKTLGCMLGRHNYKIKDLVVENVATDYERQLGYFRVSMKCRNCGCETKNIIEIPLYSEEGADDDNKA